MSHWERCRPCCALSCAWRFGCWGNGSLASTRAWLCLLLDAAMRRRCLCARYFVCVFPSPALAWPDMHVRAKHIPLAHVTTFQSAARFHFSLASSSRTLHRAPHGAVLAPFFSKLKIRSVFVCVRVSVCPCVRVCVFVLHWRRRHHAIVLDTVTPTPQQALPSTPARSTPGWRTTTATTAWMATATTSF